MSIIVNLDVMMAKRKISSQEAKSQKAQGITLRKTALLKSKRLCL